MYKYLGSTNCTPAFKSGGRRTVRGRREGKPDRIDRGRERKRE